MSLYSSAIIAGFGGQGIMLIGNLLAYAAMRQGLNVTFMPVYGVEMRGGTSSCTVVFSDEEIGSPIIRHPQGVIVLNQPSLERFQPRVEKDGFIIINSSLAQANQADTGRLRCFAIPANDLAEKLGNARLLNMVALGAYFKALGSLLPLESAENCLEQVSPGQSQSMLSLNAEALRAGYAEAKAL
ncbi:MAG: 2-oxoacid:acceptor oxidoreductase family protein [Desulfovibrionaceae bacterium]|nr:2-oxoacid:acceptor oxidoreductase family protein [Desulfovibrionaceae bacterium]